MVNYCFNCAAKIDKGSFCWNCGTSFEGIQQKPEDQTQSQEIPQVSYIQIPQEQQQPVSPIKNEEQLQLQNQYEPVVSYSQSVDEQLSTDMNPVLRKYSRPRNVWRIVYPILIYFGVSVIFGFIVSFVMIIGISIRSIANTGAVGSNGAQVFEENFLLVTLICSLACILIFGLIWKNDKKYLQKFINKGSGIGVTFLTILTFACLSLFITAVMGLTDIIKYFPSYDIVARALTMGSVTVQILSIGFVGPISEELLFRGLIHNRLSTWMPMWAAVLIGNAIFALIHFNLFQSIYAFLIGVALTGLYIRFRNLLIPIIAHIAFNMTSIVLRAVLEAAYVEKINYGSIMFYSVMAMALSLSLFLRLTKPAVPVVESGVDSTEY